MDDGWHGVMNEPGRDYILKFLDIDFLSLLRFRLLFSCSFLLWILVGYCTDTGRVEYSTTILLIPYFFFFFLACWV